MRAQTGGRGIAALILNIGTRWKQAVNFMPKVHYSWERTLVPTEWKARWAQSWSGQCEEQKICCPCWD